MQTPLGISEENKAGFVLHVEKTIEKLMSILGVPVGIQSA